MSCPTCSPSDADRAKHDDLETAHVGLAVVLHWDLRDMDKQSTEFAPVSSTSLFVCSILLVTHCPNYSYN